MKINLQFEFRTSQRQAVMMWWMTVSPQQRSLVAMWTQISLPPRRKKYESRL
jgi:hypothetical protein